MIVAAKTKPDHERPACIVLEDLNVRGMLKNHKLARSIADMGFYEFRRQLEYKARSAGSLVYTVSRWEPSSKTCSWCGWIDEDLTLSDRIFHCCECGYTIDRDLNAAINLALDAAG
jgi:putative transposase